MRAINESPHGHLDGEAPADATGNSEAAKSLRFDLKGKAAEDAATQDRVARRKRERLEEAGAFREPEPTNRKGLPARGYKPRYKTGPPITVVRIDQLTGEVVGDANGREKRARIKDVMLVPPDSTATRDPPGQGATGDARIIRQQRTATEDLKLRVANILASPKTLTELRAPQPREPGDVARAEAHAAQVPGDLARSLRASQRQMGRKGRGGKRLGSTADNAGVIPRATRQGIPRGSALKDRISGAAWRIGAIYA